MSKKVEVSVIMGVYQRGGESSLLRAIESILNQTFHDFEFLICDDGCEMGISEYLSNISRWDDRIILLKNKENYGLAESLNRCLQKASGRYIARMDADDICGLERLQKEYEFLEEHIDISLVGCSAWLIDQRKVWGKRIVKEKPAKKDFLIGQPFIHPTVMVRSEVYRELGGYCATRLTRRAEDYDFFMRMYQKGYRGYNIPEALYYYAEDKDFYKKVSYFDRIREAKIRFQGYIRLELMPIGLIYCIKPLILGVVPSGVLTWIHRKRYQVSDMNNMGNKEC